MATVTDYQDLDEYASPWLSAADLDGSTNVEISGYEVGTFTEKDGSEVRKLVVNFEGIRKGLVLNKTNARTIENLTGTRSPEEWIGREVNLYTARVMAFGKEVDAVRIRAAEQEERLFDE